MSKKTSDAPSSTSSSLSTYVNSASSVAVAATKGASSAAVTAAKGALYVASAGAGVVSDYISPEKNKRVLTPDEVAKQEWIKQKTYDPTHGGKYKEPSLVESLQRAYNSLWTPKLTYPCDTSRIDAKDYEWIDDGSIQGRAAGIGLKKKDPKKTERTPRSNG
ncbi:hypothetical protein AgCh_035503 [Apium graveolens]